MRDSCDFTVVSVQHVDDVVIGAPYAITEDLLDHFQVQWTLWYIRTYCIRMVQYMQTCIYCTISVQKMYTLFWINIWDSLSHLPEAVHVSEAETCGSRQMTIDQYLVVRFRDVKLGNN